MSRGRRYLGNSFPLRVPRQPQGEAFPTASEDFAYQIRGTNDTPGLDEGLYACIPDEAGTGWQWAPWFYLTEEMAEFLPKVVIDGGMFGSLGSGDILVYDGVNDEWTNQQQHPFIVEFVSSPPATAAWTDMPLALTELYGGTTYRKRIDLTAFTNMRLHVEVTTPGATGATLDIQYSQDIIGPTWVSTGCDVDIGSAGWALNPYVTVPDDAKEDVLLRIVGEGGDGAADPAFANIYAEFH